MKVTITDGGFPQVRMVQLLMRTFRKPVTQRLENRLTALNKGPT